MNVPKGPLRGLRQLLATKNPIKMVKNAFCFKDIQIFVLIFSVVSENSLITLILKLMKLPNGKQKITTHILPNKSRYKGHQKFTSQYVRI